MRNEGHELEEADPDGIEDQPVVQVSPPKVGVDGLDRSDDIGQSLAIA